MTTVSVLDSATKHFRTALSGEMKSITVPEWSDSKIYFKQTTTLREQSKLFELTNSGKTVEALVETLIIKARNADGTRMFNPVDKVTFMNEVDPNVLIRIIGEINEISSLGSSEEISKN